MVAVPQATATRPRRVPDETKPLALPDTKGWEKPDRDDKIIVVGTPGIWSFVQSYLCGTPKQYPEKGDHAFEAALLIPWGKRHAPAKEWKIAVAPWADLRLVVSWKEV